MPVIPLRGESQLPSAGIQPVSVGIKGWPSTIYPSWTVPPGRAAPDVELLERTQSHSPARELGEAPELPPGLKVLVVDDSAVPGAIPRGIPGMRCCTVLRDAGGSTEHWSVASTIALACAAALCPSGWF